MEGIVERTASRLYFIFLNKLLILSAYGSQVAILASRCLKKGSDLVPTRLVESVVPAGSF